MKCTCGFTLEEKLSNTITRHYEKVITVKNVPISVCNNCSEELFRGSVCRRVATLGERAYETDVDTIEFDYGTDWDKLANIAVKSMELKNFTIDDVRDDLKEYRDKNKDSVSMREIPMITGKDAERFMKSVRRNNNSMEERKSHLKKSIENAARIERIEEVLLTHCLGCRNRLKRSEYMIYGAWCGNPECQKKRKLSVEREKRRD